MYDIGETCLCIYGAHPGTHFSQHKLVLTYVRMYVMLCYVMLGNEFLFNRAARSPPGQG